MNFEKYQAIPGEDITLSKYDTHAPDNQMPSQEIKDTLKRDVEEISKWQYKLFAEGRQSLLIIFQGMDSAGKDGTIKHIMSGVNPQGVDVYSFKHPSVVELDHDFLWRHAIKLPGHGQITIFNRSHYENVLISKVHPEIVLAQRLHGIDTVDNIDKEFWHRRYKQINNFEETTIQNGTQILKLFLHISKEEQCKRFLERIENKDKHWKFSSNDITERKFWTEYEAAYEKAFKHTSTSMAPWYIIPADDKAFTHMLIGQIILAKLKDMNPVFPPINSEEAALLNEAKAELENESSALK